MTKYLTCPDGHTTEQTGAILPVCIKCGYDPEDDLNAFVNGVNEALTEKYGPNHQQILSQGKVISSFDWTK